MSKGINDSFSLPHILGYSTIAVQEMNMAYHYPIIYWNTANLIVDSGSNEELLGQSTDYGKVATALTNMRQRGTEITLPLINEAEFEFVPDEKNNRIIYSLKALCGIGDDMAQSIVANRPYSSLEDFVDRVKVTPSQMIQLIKAGCFTELDGKDRIATMRKYLKEYVFEPNQKLTTSSIDIMEEMGIIPDNKKLYVRIKRFKDYVTHESFLVKEVINPKKKVPKKGYHDRIFVLDDTSTPFFQENFSEDSIVGIKDDHPTFSEKLFLKEWKKKVDVLRDWLKKSETLQTYNSHKFKDLWNEKASGTIPKWEMDSLSFYYTEHELENLNEEKYGVVNYFDLPEEPEPYDYYTRYINGERKQIPKLKITRLAGTVIDSNNIRHTVALLTKEGVVNIKYNKGQFSYYKRQISTHLNSSDKKTILEKSWFTRGTKLLICGYRQDDIFRAYRYKDTLYMHTTNKITDVDNDGNVEIQTDRIKA